MTSTQTWVRRIHAHYDSELLKLVQLGMTKDEALSLASEENTIIYDKIYMQRMHALKLTKSTDLLKYTARSIWITLQAHEAMAEFTVDDPKYNNFISAAFIRFLTRHIGGSAVTKQLSEVRSLANAAKTAANSAKSAAETAKSTAESAKSSAASTQSKLDNHTNYFNGFVAKNKLQK